MKVTENSPAYTYPLYIYENKKIKTHRSVVNVDSGEGWLPPGQRHHRQQHQRDQQLADLQASPFRSSTVPRHCHREENKNKQRHKNTVKHLFPPKEKARLHCTRISPVKYHHHEAHYGIYIFYIIYIQPFLLGTPSSGGGFFTDRPAGDSIHLNKGRNRVAKFDYPDDLRLVSTWFYTVLAFFFVVQGLVGWSRLESQNSIAVVEKYPSIFFSLLRLCWQSFTRKNTIRKLLYIYHRPAAVLSTAVIRASHPGKGDDKSGKDFSRQLARSIHPRLQSSRQFEKRRHESVGYTASVSWPSMLRRVCLASPLRIDNHSSPRLLLPLPVLYWRCAVARRFPRTRSYTLWSRR